MLIAGSCHCGAVRFAVESPHPYPFNLCYCRTCRKTAGGGGHAINLSARAATLQIEGQEHIQVYCPGEAGPTEAVASPQQRRFCQRCGSALWIQDRRWPELIHPFASAIDTELPVPPDRNHLMLEFKAAWVPVHADRQDHRFDRYPDQTIAEWHASRSLTDEG